MSLNGVEEDIRPSNLMWATRRECAQLHAWLGNNNNSRPQLHSRPHSKKRPSVPPKVYVRLASSESDAEEDVAMSDVDCGALGATNGWVPFRDCADASRALGVPRSVLCMVANGYQPPRWFEATRIDPETESDAERRDRLARAGRAHATKRSARRASNRVQQQHR